MFEKAKAIWIKDRKNDQNLFACFETEIGCYDNVKIRITAATFYRIFINGIFVAFGPARTSKGCARVDVISISEFLTSLNNVVRIEVAGYNCCSLSTCKTPSFLCAEVFSDGSVMAYTGKDFYAKIMTEKEQYTNRYSIQRHFTEVWDYTQNQSVFSEIEEVNENIKYLDRIVSYPKYRKISLKSALFKGEYIVDVRELDDKKITYSWLEIPEYWGRFSADATKYNPYLFLDNLKQNITQRNINLPITINKGEYILLDFSRVECGFFTFDISVAEKSDLVVGFSEYIENDAFSFFNMRESHNVIEYILPKASEKKFMSFEPYTGRYLIVAVKRGRITINSAGIITYEKDMAGARKIDFADKTQENIYNAALRSFAHNSVDIFTDCPSRERAGWLCDSYFTAIVEHYFFAKTNTEDAFLENYLNYTNEILPEGAVPMCYPSDIVITTKGLLYNPHDDSTALHIPQWCMWFVIEVGEYLTERNPGADKERFREKIEGILKYLEKYENEEGMLEDLPSWNFVEWSDANLWTKNVNYPTNFLYSKVLMTAFELYGNISLQKKAIKLQELTIKKSFNGEIFTDNALRDDKQKLHNTGNTSEACQYYALLFGGVNIDDAKYSKLKACIKNGFDYYISEKNMVEVNAFLGFYLRLKLLLEIGEYDLVLKEAVDFCGQMAQKTQTLWENKQLSGSFDHGFASYIAYAMCVAQANKTTQGKIQS